MDPLVVGDIDLGEWPEDHVLGARVDRVGHCANCLAAVLVLVHLR